MSVHLKNIDSDGDGINLKHYGAIEISNDESQPLVSDSNSTKSTKNGYEAASLWSQLFFGWLTPILEIGNVNGQLNVENLSDVPLPMSDSTVFIMNEYRKHWMKELELKPEENRKPQVLRAIWNTVYRDYCYAGLIKLAHDLLQFVGPQVLHALIVFLRTPEAPMWYGLSLTAGVTVAQILMSLCLRHYFFQCYRVGLRVRTIVITSVYQKSLTMSSSTHQHRRGEITNLMSVDAQRLQETTTYLHSIWFSFVQIIIAMFFLYRELGVSIFAGVLVILVSIPLTGGIARVMGKLQKSLMKCKDERIEVNNEVLGNMKVIKLQAWEKPFARKVNRLRKLELTQLFWYMMGRIMNVLVYSIIPLAISITTFGTYALLGNKLDVASALTALALFEILRFPLFMFPNTINNIVEAIVALNRIDAFLQSTDHQCVTSGSLEDVGVEIANASFVYENKRLEDDTDWEEKLLRAQLADAEDQLAILEGQKEHIYKQISDGSSNRDLLSLSRVNMTAKKGEFIAVVGGVGCGKSTLLKALLGEVRQLSGVLQLRGKLAYSAQAAFIMNGTLKQNIVFGKPEKDNPELYRRTIDACALKHDLEILLHGDETIIGEKGITLSGGQKARISMARALYHNADIFLLDDPLAAVDALVGRKIFQECIVESMLLGKGASTNDVKDNISSNKKRTVVLVTNALQYLSHPLVDRIIVLKEGKVIERGSYNELNRNQRSHFKTFLDSFNETRTSDNEKRDNVSIINDDDSKEAELFRQDTSEAKLSRRKSLNKSLSVKDGKKVSLMNDEMRDRETGRVALKVYVTWAKAAGGVWIIVAIILANVFNEAMKFASNWWLTLWSEHGDENMQDQMHFLSVYALIAIGATVTTFISSMTLMILSLRASKRLFSRVLEATMRAPMAFYDTTPLGQIINRFSKDIYTTDEAIPNTLRSYMMTMAKSVSTVIVISAVTPIFTLCLIPMLYLYRVLQKYFSITYRELKRLDSVQRSPIYALFGETLDGVPTIRAFEAEKSLMTKMVHMLDNQQHAYFLNFAAISWLAVRLEIMSASLVLFACLFAVLERDAQNGNETFAGLAGLAISYALSATQSLNWTIRTGSNFEANMVSVERLEQYSNLKAEAPSDTDYDKEVLSWPRKGEIDFQNVALRYRPELPRVLKSLNLKIPGNSKVGIVGRTGAGKSTLMTALMRIVEVDSGQILIDGVNTRMLGLEKLRSKIAVIPQDPVLFSGTIKTNLDPFDEYSIERLENVLERVGLMQKGYDKTPVKSLEDRVLEGGENFSVGQRQLLVIGRALLSEVSVVICDEATAAVDAETDKLMQTIFRSNFKNATCLTVAHRLNTIMDSDYVLVMHDGKAAEFDTPGNLLRLKNGRFRELVDAWEKEHSN